VCIRDEKLCGEVKGACVREEGTRAGQEFLAAFQKKKAIRKGEMKLSEKDSC